MAEKSKPAVRAALDRVDAAAARDDAEAVARRAQVGQPGPAPRRRVVGLDLADRARLPPRRRPRRRARRPPPRRCRRAACACPAASPSAARRQVALGDLEVAAAGGAAGEHVERTAGDRAGEMLARDAHVGPARPAAAREVVDLERRERARRASWRRPPHRACRRSRRPPARRASWARPAAATSGRGAGRSGTARRPRRAGRRGRCSRRRRRRPRGTRPRPDGSARPASSARAASGRGARS